MPSRPLLPVAFPGAPGAYSEAAARAFFGSAHPTLTRGNAADAVLAVVEGRASHVVLPVENAITGTYAGVPEALFGSPLVVAGEIELALLHCLLGAQDARLDEIAVVRSHPTVLAQCRDWLASFGVATRVAPDTAQAARELAQNGERALAVIGSAHLASAYGLSILAEGISDRAANTTRFLVLAAESETAPDPEGRRSALLVGPIQTPRAIKTLRTRLESLGATRARAPYLGSEDGTLAVVEFAHQPGLGPEIAREAAGCVPHRWLGTWKPAPRAADARRRPA